jgi:uncharacterized protein (TIGR04222 family)
MSMQRHPGAFPPNWLSDVRDGCGRRDTAVVNDPLISAFDDAAAADALTLTEIACLAGGQRAVVLTALVALHEGQAAAVRGRSVTSRGRGPTPRPGGSRGSGGPDVTVVRIWRRLRVLGLVPVGRFLRDAEASEAAREVEVALAARGLVERPSVLGRRRRASRFATVLGPALLAVTVLAAVCGSPVLSVAALVVALPTFAVPPLLGRRPRLTPVGTLALEGLRNRHQLLADGGMPGERALAVAVFGPDLLWPADPVLADALAGRGGAVRW